MKEEWLFPGAIVPVDVETTATLVAEIKRLIDVVGGMALAQQEQEQGEPVYEPSKTQTKQIVDGLNTCHHPISKHEFLKTWIRDWTIHKITLAKQEQRSVSEHTGEPVAWVNHGENRITRATGWDGYGALYTTPQRKPLTDEQIVLIVSECAASHQHTDIHFARAIEAAHGIKE
jgi:hypothetical protein